MCSARSVCSVYESVYVWVRSAWPADSPADTLRVRMKSVEKYRHRPAGREKGGRHKRAITRKKEQWRKNTKRYRKIRTEMVERIENCKERRRMGRSTRKHRGLNAKGEEEGRAEAAYVAGIRMETEGMKGKEE